MSRTSKDEIRVVQISNINIKQRDSIAAIANQHIVLLVPYGLRLFDGSAYTAPHSDFVVCYRPSVTEVLAELSNWQVSSDVSYSDRVPNLQWFACSPSEMLAPILGVKSTDSTCEEEHRVILDGPVCESAFFDKVDPSQIAGVILGARTSSAIEAKAMALQKIRKGFKVERVTAEPSKFQLTTYPVDENVRVFSEFP